MRLVQRALEECVVEVCKQFRGFAEYLIFGLVAFFQHLVDLVDGQGGDNALFIRILRVQREADAHAVNPGVDRLVQVRCVDAGGQVGDEAGLVCAVDEVQHLRVCELFDDGL